MDVDIACAGFRSGNGRLSYHAHAARGPSTPTTLRLKAKSRPACRCRCSATNAPTISPQASAASSRALREFAPAFPISILPTSPWPPRSPRSACSICSIPSAPAGAPRTCVVGDAIFASVRQVAGRAWRTTPSSCPGHRGFLHKHGGLVLSIGQFNQWVGSQLMASGLVQIWPGTPVSEPLFAGNCRRRHAPRRPGRRPSRQARRRLHARHGCPRAPHGRRRWPRRRGRPRHRSSTLACPPAMRRRDWALGMKMVIELPEVTKTT